MAEQEFGPRRCRDTRKPLQSQCPDTGFHRCGECGALFTITGGKTDSKILCCGVEAKRLIAKQPDLSVIDISYQIVGGYNNNAVKVFWKAGLPEFTPEWIYLKTFTGGYVKYLTNTKKSPMVFALADTDAFSYCDEDPCLECVFRCKRGFVIYVFSASAGLFELPIDKMTANWQSKAD